MWPKAQSPHIIFNQKLKQNTAAAINILELLDPNFVGVQMVENLARQAVTEYDKEINIFNKSFDIFNHLSRIFFDK